MRTKHVALLRGINVGRAKRIAMADLRDMVQRLGYSNVPTRALGDGVTTRNWATFTKIRALLT